MAQIKTNLTYGTTGTLPAVSGANLTSLNGTQVTSGTLPMARLSGTLPALNGSALTTINASNISSGTLNSARYTAGGITMSDQWRVTTGFTGVADPIASNWERSDTAPQASLGTGMTESSGIFTFPSTGFYYVTFTSGSWSNNQGAMVYQSCKLQTTVNDSDYNEIARNRFSIYGNTAVNMAVTSTLVDITDTSNQKIRFAITDNAATAEGSSSYNRTYAVFIRLGDT